MIWRLSRLTTCEWPSPTGSAHISQASPGAARGFSRVPPGTGRSGSGGGSTNRRSPWLIGAPPRGSPNPSGSYAGSRADGQADLAVAGQQGQGDQVQLGLVDPAAGQPDVEALPARPAGQHAGLEGG